MTIILSSLNIERLEAQEMYKVTSLVGEGTLFVRHLTAIGDFETHRYRLDENGEYTFPIYKLINYMAFMRLDDGGRRVVPATGIYRAAFITYNGVVVEHIPLRKGDLVPSTYKDGALLTSVERVSDYTPAEVTEAIYKTIRFDTFREPTVYPLCIKDIRPARCRAVRIRDEQIALGCFNFNEDTEEVVPAPATEWPNTNATRRIRQLTEPQALGGNPIADIWIA